MLCIAMLVSAAIAFSAVNDVDNFYDDYVDNLGDDYVSSGDGIYIDDENNDDENYDDERQDDEKYDDADSYKWAIGWLLCIAFVAIIFHTLMMMIRCHLCLRPSLKYLFKFYAILVSFLDANT